MKKYYTFSEIYILIFFTFNESLVYIDLFKQQLKEFEISYFLKCNNFEIDFLYIFRKNYIKSLIICNNDLLKYRLAYPMVYRNDSKYIN